MSYNPFASLQWLLDGKTVADLAVLSDDYFAVPTERIGGLESLLTLVGGKPVYAAEPFAALEVTPQ